MKLANGERPGHVSDPPVALYGSPTMSSRDREQGKRPGIRDIGTFVESYKKLVDKLFPVFVIWDAVLFVAR